MIIKNQLFSEIITHLTEQSSLWGKIYLVGGTVRDALVDKENIDLDFAVRCNAKKAARIIADKFQGYFYVLDEEREAARALIDFRGERKKIDFTAIIGNSIEEDLSNRDFTINAIAVDLEHSDVLIDPLNGYQHLQKRLLKLCSDKSLINDPVRTLRAVRFINSYGLDYDPVIKKQVRFASVKLDQVSSERRRDEIFNIFSDTDIGNSLALMQELNIFEKVFPDLVPLKSIIPGLPHTHNVLDHSIRVAEIIQQIFQLIKLEEYKTENDNLMYLRKELRGMREAIKDFLASPINPDRSYEGLLILSALFHDSGKLDTEPTEIESRKKYPGHAKRSAEILKAWAEKMALSNAESEFINMTVRYHMKSEFSDFSPSGDNRTDIYRFYNVMGTAGVLVGFLHLSDLIATYEQDLNEKRWQKGVGAVKILLDAWFHHQNDIVNPPKIVSGDDIIQKFQYKPGKELGRILEEIRVSQAAGSVKNKKDALEYAKQFINGA